MEIALRHIRDGVELQPIDVNRNYDFNFQRTNFIPNVQILPVNIYKCIALLYIYIYVTLTLNMKESDCGITCIFTV